MMVSKIKSREGNLRLFGETLLTLWFVALFVVGFALILVSARQGIGTSPDSAAYLNGAKNLALGHGFSTLNPDGNYSRIQHFAPLYSFVLAGPIRLGLPILEAGRWTNAVLFGVFALLIGVLIVTISPTKHLSDFLAAAAVVGLIVIGTAEIFLFAWSEALFLPLLFVSLWLLARYLDTHRLVWLAASALVVGMACLVRFAGMGAVMAGFTAIILLSQSRRRFLHAISYGGIAVAPLLIWTLLGGMTEGKAPGSREFLFHPVTTQQLQEALTTFGSWLLIPASAPGIIKLLPYLILCGVILFILFSYRLRLATPSSNETVALPASLPWMVSIGLIFIPVYILFVIFSISFIDANTPLDRRLLSPVYVAGILLIYFLLRRILSIFGAGRIQKWAVILGLVGFLFLTAYKMYPSFRESHSNGLGFTAFRWRESKIIAETVQFADINAVYSNAPEAFLLHTALPAFLLPKKTESSTRQENPLYEQQMAQMTEWLNEPGRQVVLFTDFPRGMLPTADDLQNRYGLVIISRADDGIILGDASSYPR